MKKPMSAWALALAAAVCSADDFSKFSDLEFAERYAFSTNRAALVSELKRGSGQWYFYSLLNFQNARRPDEEEKFLNSNHRTGLSYDAWRRLQLRHMFLAWEANPGGNAGRTTDEFLSWDLKSFLGIEAPAYVREVEAAPDTYPSVLDQKEISFDAFLNAGFSVQTCFRDKFRFLAYAGWVNTPTHSDYFDSWTEALPGTPGHFEAVRKRIGSRKAYENDKGYKALTLAELDALADAYEKEKWRVPLLENRDFIAAYRSRLAPGADEDAGDPDVRRAALDRLLAFARRLPESQGALKTGTLRNILALERSRGNFSERALFAEFLRDLLHQAGLKKAAYAWRTDDALVADYLSAYRREKRDDLADFKDLVPAEQLARVCAETDLLSGVPAEKVDASKIPDAEFKKLRERVELRWCASNPKVFASDGPAALEIDVKNVPKMRLAIYELDAYRASVRLGAEPKSDIDLDGCVPGTERTLDFSSIAPIVRHRERLDLPELARPGVYVVECSGAGMSSRAIVRRGSIRVVERAASCGHVFTALDEKGAVLKPSQLRVGETTYVSDGRGDIVVPFATRETAGRKKAVVGAGGRAAVHEFDHRAESFGLTLDVFVPPESLVAGAEAKAVVSARLTVGGAPASLSLVERPVLTVTLSDGSETLSVRRIEDFALSDSAEGVCTFTVPQRLRTAAFALSGKVRSASEGKDVDVASPVRRVLCRGITASDRILQPLLRRGADGFSVELRGRNGEPLAGREVELEFRHLAFTKPMSKRFQSDASGRVRLGALADIVSMELKSPVKISWYLRDESLAALPSELTAVEGESFELSVPGLLSGAWPHADDLAARASLASYNREGACTATFPGALSYADGMLCVKGLAPGDYKLFLRAEDRVIALKVAKSSAPAANGVIPGAHRMIADTGAPGRICIAEAARDGRRVSARLRNAAPDARVHLVAGRYRSNEGELARFLAGRLSRTPASASDWTPAKSEYVSERDLGDRLRYIFDRRNLPHRPGNMLERPSLLLSPWSVSETQTAELTARSGEEWRKAEEDAMVECSAELPVGLSRGGGSPGLAIAFAQPCYDFLVSPAFMVLNARPGEDGSVAFELPEGGDFQDVALVAVDSLGVDSRRMLSPTSEPALRDIRHRGASAAKGVATLERAGRVVRGTSAAEGRDERVRRCDSVASAFDLVRSFAEPGDLAAFEFLSRWNALADDEQRRLYGEYASHELDLFLWFKDRRFFDAVVAPNLRNKRHKRFLDRWLLGDDVSAWAEPGALQDLDAVEMCLLAKRVPAAAEKVARLLAAECEAHPVDSALRASRLSLALSAAKPEAQGRESEAEWLPADGVAGLGFDRKFSARRNASVGEMVADSAEEEPAAELWSSQMVVRDKAKEGLQRMAVSARTAGQLRAGRAPSAQLADDAARRGAARQPYRPPERTREWIETHHYRVRHADERSVRAGANAFWRDYAAAVAAGKDAEFLSENVIEIGTGLFERIGALAVLALPFDAKGAKGAVEFSERRVEREDSGVRDIGIVQRFADVSAPKDGETKYVTDEFVAGRPYRLVTVFSNPSERPARLECLVQVPDGAIALRGGRGADLRPLALDGYSMQELSVLFYFPSAEAAGRHNPAVAVADGKMAGVAGPFECRVVAKQSKEDTSSWQWISQNGTSDEVIAFLAAANLASGSVDLGKIGWRMRNDAFARRVFETLDARGVFHEGLWLTNLEGRRRITDFRDRVRQLFMRREMRNRLAKELGPSFHCALVDIEPDETDLFEYAEFWPLVNARAHALGGKATIPNETLRQRYRGFLDYLATKSALSAKDRLDAAVYFVAQDRVEEAERMVAGLEAKDVETKMQLDYLRAYFAFSRLEPEKGREIALRYADWPVPRWRDRFRAVIAQADEIAGRGPAAAEKGRDEVASAPSLELSAETAGGETRAIVVRGLNVASATVRAFPTDVEVTFSKDPFGGAGVKAASAFLRPAWEAEVDLSGAEDAAKVEIPEALRGVNLLVEATDGEGRVTASLNVLSGALDVYAATEYGELRVRDRNGRAVPAAYVKVYARDASGRETKFHKDGYTDLRGAFAYAAVSTDSPFRPSEFAILVISDRLGVRTLTAKAP